MIPQCRTFLNCNVLLGFNVFRDLKIKPVMIIANLRVIDESQANAAAADLHQLLLITIDKKKEESKFESN